MGEANTAKFYASSEIHSPDSTQPQIVCRRNIEMWEPQDSFAAANRDSYKGNYGIG